MLKNPSTPYSSGNLAAQSLNSNFDEILIKVEKAYMEKVEKLTQEKAELSSRNNKLELLLEDNQVEKDAKYISLKSKYENLLNEKERLKNFATLDEDPSNYSSDQLSQMIRNFKSLKNEMLVLKANHDKYAKEWVKDLDQSSGHYIEVNNLRTKYDELNQKFLELDLKIQKEGESKFQEQVKQREEIIKSQAEHIQKILWESHKLREYIRQELDVVVHPVDFKIFRIQDLGDQKDVEQFNLIQDQSNQILALRKKVYLLTNQLKENSLGQVDRENVQNELQDAKNGSEKEKSQQDYYVALQNSIEQLRELERRFKGVVKQKKSLETEISLVRSQFQETSEIQEQQLADSSNEIRKLLKINMDLSKELNELKLQLSKLNSSQNQGLQSANQVNLGRVISFGKVESNHNIFAGTQDKDSIWEQIQITVEERYNPGLLLNTDLEQLRSLIKEVNYKVQTFIDSKQNQSVSTSLGLANKDQTESSSRDVMAQEQKLRESGNILNLKEACQKNLRILEDEFSSILPDIEADDELLQMSPILMCYKLKSLVIDLKAK